VTCVTVTELHCIFSNLHDCIGAAGSKFDLDTHGVWCVCVTRYAMQTSGVVGRSDNGWCRGPCYHKSISNHYLFFIRHWILPHILKVSTATRWYDSSIVHVFAAIQLPFEEQGSLFFVDSGASSPPSVIHIHISSRNHRKNTWLCCISLSRSSLHSVRRHVRETYHCLGNPKGSATMCSITICSCKRHCMSTSFHGRLAL